MDPSFEVANECRPPSLFDRGEHPASPTLFFLFSAFWWFDSSLLLGFGLFHGFLGFGRALGTGFGTLLTFFFLQLLAAKEFDERLFGAVTLLPAGTHDSQVTAFPVTETWANGIEELVHCFTGHEVSRGLTASREIATFAQRYHLFNLRPKRLGLGHSGLDALFNNQ